MKLSKDLEGKVVTIQLARPLYICDYAGHMQHVVAGLNQQALLCEPVVQKEADQVKPLVMDLLLGVVVRDVSDDHLVVRTVTPGNHWCKITVPSSLIMQVVELTAFEPNDLPTVTKHVRQVAQEPLVKL